MPDDPAPFVFDKSWEFDVPLDRLWEVFTDTGSFTRWWPWLRRFDPIPLEAGGRTRCSIGPPLPYLLNVDLQITEVVPRALVRVDVLGDARGPARLEVAETDVGSIARLAWELSIHRTMLRMAAAVGRPVLQWGHDWVISNGVEQFRRRALRSS